MQNLQLNPPTPRYHVERCRWWWNVVNDQGAPVDRHHWNAKRAQIVADLYNMLIAYGYELGKKDMLEAIRKQKIANNLPQQ